MIPFGFVISYLLFHIQLELFIKVVTVLALHLLP